MSKHGLTQSQSDIRSEACAWLAQLETGKLKPADVASFREWVNRSPRHAQEIRLAARFSANLDGLADLSPYLNEEAERIEDIVSLNRSSPTPSWIWAIASVVFLMVGLLLFQTLPTNNPASHWQTQLTTAVGEYRAIDLPDGSRIEVNTNSQLSVNYSASIRAINLQSGEALFTVASNPQRPFIVTAGARTIAAVGTAFQVRHDASRFEVTVTEGTVRLEAKPSPVQLDDKTRQDESVTSLLEPVLLHAGKRYLTTALLESESGQESPVIEEISDKDIKRKLAWKEGLLDFSNTSIEIIIEEVTRYQALEIRIGDPSLRELKFGGLFRAGDVDPLLQTLESFYGIQAEFLDDSTIVLTRAN